MKQPLELDQISEPDDQDIEKMLLTDREKAFKEVYWANKHKDWIKQDNEKKRAKKAQRKRKELISAHQSSLRSDKSDAPGSPTSIQNLNEGGLGTAVGEADEQGSAA